ncbi:zinc finger BED domain-containing RICESLEEPER 2-like [Brachionus plicatilis]|uniref:Zinc finger BED domain-containing RICESLEEPER 2-like n=1 Tax=Brachionus plicatilis TaxID=10195 RepID=A0A3M7QL71_BRAPC|nr:zinc finger BED domain-containing RICESLEEPER 2-like [Brachionus plicatilis]
MESSDISSGLESCHESSYSSESISLADNKEDSNRSNQRIDNSDVTSLAQTISIPDNSNSSIPCTKHGVVIKSEKGTTSKKFKPELDKILVEWIIDDLQPISLVTSQKFIKFINYLDSSYQVPCRSKIDYLIDEYFEKGIQKKKEMISQIKNKFHFTSEIWTSNSQDPYISITSDYASNMIKAFNRFKRQYETEGIILIHLRCFAHILHLMVLAFLKDKSVTDLVSKLRMVVKKIKKKSLKSDLKALCVLNREPELSVKLDVKTRWNSTFEIINCSLKIKKSISDLCLKQEFGLMTFNLNNQEWLSLSYVEQFLEPFKKATLDLSSESLTFSHFYPIMEYLKKHLNKSLAKREFVAFKSGIEKSIDKFNKYWKEAERFALLTHILDPRFKLSLIETSKKSAAKQVLKETFDSFSLLNESETSTVGQNEIDRYFCTPVISYHTDTIVWWSTSVKDFPILSKIAFEY